MAQIDRAAFFAAVRSSYVCGPTLSQDEVDGLAGILDAWDRYGPASDLRHVAYTMATAWHEVKLIAATREIGQGKGKAYGVADPKGSGLVFYGRGPCQITWRSNYERFGKLLGVDLVGKPDLALEPETGAAILIIGSRDGLFRPGKTLARYFSATADDAVNARDIINGDVAKNGRMIAGYHALFLKSLRASVVTAPAALMVAVAAPAPAAATTKICPTCHRQLAA